MIFRTVSARPPRSPACASRRLIVGIEIPEAAASCSCVHSRRARAALTWRIDIFNIDKQSLADRYLKYRISR